MPPMAVDPAISVSERSKNHSLARVTTGTGMRNISVNFLSSLSDPLCSSCLLHAVQIAKFLSQAVHILFSKISWTFVVKQTYFNYSSHIATEKFQCLQKKTFFCSICRNPWQAFDLIGQRKGVNT